MSPNIASSRQISPYVAYYRLILPNIALCRLKLHIVALCCLKFLYVVNIAQLRQELPNASQYLVHIFAKIQQISLCPRKLQTLAARQWPRIAEAYLSLNDAQFGLKTDSRCYGD